MALIRTRRIFGLLPGSYRQRAPADVLSRALSVTRTTLVPAVLAILVHPMAAIADSNNVCLQTDKSLATCQASAESGDMQQTLADCASAVREVSPCVDKALGSTYSDEPFFAERMMIWTLILERAEELRLGGGAAVSVGNLVQAQVMLRHSYDDYVWLRDGNPPADVPPPLPKESDLYKQTGAQYSTMIYNLFAKVFGSPPP